MYGFSGYGTSAYGSERQSGALGPIGPIVKLAMRTVQNSYNTVFSLMLRFRNLTLSNPQSTNTTLEL